MTLPTARVFLSSTSGDLRSQRGLLRDNLLMNSILPIEQGDFPPEYRMLVDSLQEKIINCDAVICLVGRVFGAAPQQNTDPPRSYTQLEYDMAIQLGKPVFVLLTSDEFVSSDSVEEPPIKAQWQQAHRGSLLESHACRFFRSDAELLTRLIQTIPRLLELVGYRAMRCVHPPTPPSFFAGRQRELGQLRESLVKRTPAAIAVVGLGGQGKTTLLNEAVTKMSRFPFAAGFWCSAYRGGYSFDNFLDDALSYLDSNGFDKRNCPETQKRVRLLIAELQKRPTLIVIDGLERWLNGWNKSAGESEGIASHDERRSTIPGLDDFLSAASGLSNGTHLAITTRALPTVLDPPIACSMVPVLDEGMNSTLSGLDDSDAVALLKNLGVCGDDATLLKAASDYDNHPLALEVLAGLLSNYEGGLIERAPMVHVLDPKKRLFKLLDTTRAQLPREKLVHEFLEVAAHFLENPSLKSLGHVIRERRWRWLPSWIRRSWPSFSLIDQGMLQEVAVALARWNLLRWNGVEKSVSLHPLVKEFFLSGVKDGHGMHWMLANWYQSQPICEYPESLSQVRTRDLAVRHALKSGNHLLARELILGPFNSQGTYADWMQSRGHLIHGIELLENLADVTQGQIRGQCLLAKSSFLIWISRPEFAVSCIDDAVRLFRCGWLANAQRQITYGRTLATRGIILAMVGSSLKAVDEFTMAIAKFKTAQKPFRFCRTELFAESQRDIAKTLMNRGLAHKDIGNTTLARSDFDTSEQLHCELIGRDRSISEHDLVQLWMNRGVLFASMSKHDEAICDLRRSVDSKSKRLAQDQSGSELWLAYGRGMLGFEMIESGDYQGGIELLDTCVAELLRLRDTGRPDVLRPLAVSQMNRAHARLRLGDIENAKTDCDQSFSILQGAIGQGASHLESTMAHVRMLRSEILFRLGSIAASREDRRHSLEMFQDLMKRLSNESDIRVVFQKNAMSAIQYLVNEDPREAAFVFDKLLPEVLRSIEGPDSSEATRHTSRRVASSLHEMCEDLEQAGINLNQVPELTE